jgi:hypothetical protein
MSAGYGTPDLFGDPTRLSRKELQAALKSWKLPAGGTNAELLERYSMVCHQGRVPTHHAANAATGVAAASPKLKRAPPRETPEKRLTRFRGSCPMKTQQRIDRARTQRMYLVTKDETADMESLSCNFIVLGSTGNVYKVGIQRVPHCTCPDHAKGNLCKHILFVLLKVMAVPSHSPLVYQSAWIGSELKEMLEGMQRRFQQVSGAVLANRAVQESYSKLKQGDTSSIDNKEPDNAPSGVARRTDEEDCPICFDALGGDTTKTTYCRSRCGANFHQECIQHWLKQQRAKPTCPMCRGPWEDANNSNKKKNVPQSEGYTNLGRLQGQSPDRDTSTYNQAWDFDYRKRRRRW